jgi:hypothetical protein
VDTGPRCGLVARPDIVPEFRVWGIAGSGRSSRAVRRARPIPRA